MSTKKGFSLAGLIDGFLAGFKKTAPQEDSQVFEINDCRNPWQHNLERLAATQKAYEPTPKVESTDSLTTFVTDLAKKTFESEQHKSDSQKSEVQRTTKQTTHKRMGDATTNDMKTWWQDSVANEAEQQGNAHSAELPGKARLMKRWFQ